MTIKKDIIEEAIDFLKGISSGSYECVDEEEHERLMGEINNLTDELGKYWLLKKEEKDKSKFICNNCGCEFNIPNRMLINLDGAIESADVCPGCDSLSFSTMENYEKMEKRRNEYFG